jgi:hypothetical protein
MGYLGMCGGENEDEDEVRERERERDRVSEEEAHTPRACLALFIKQKERWGRWWRKSREKGSNIYCSQARKAARKS